jgi:uncharacterized membrane protein
MFKASLPDPIKIDFAWCPTRLRQSLERIGLSWVILVGIGLRWTNLGLGAYWGDEVYSSIRIFGHRTAELRTTIAQGHYVMAQGIQSFQQLDPLKGLDATLQSLAIEDAHLPPLYFVLVRLWAMAFGDSPEAVRSFSALCGCLLLPVMYQLALALFQRRRVALYATALVAVSPIQQIYAQEARMYSLWNLTVALSCLMLLRALQRRQRRDWGHLALVLTLSLYTHLLSVIMLAGLSGYVLLTQWRDRRQLVAFAAAAGGAMGAVSPWLWVFTHRQIVDNHDQDAFIAPMDGVLMLKNWFSSFRRCFIDFNTTLQDAPLPSLLLVLISGVCLGILGLALVGLWRSAPRSTSLFVLMLILTLPLGLFQDSLSGLLPPRWILPSYLGLQLVFAHWLGGVAAPPTWLAGTAAQWRRWRQWLLVLLLGIGLTSCLTIVRSDVWWHRGMSECNREAAQLIDQSPRPLVLSDGVGGEFFDHALSNVISLSRLVKPATLFQVVLEPAIPTLEPQGFSDIWVLTPSQHLRDWLHNHYPGQIQPHLRFHNLYRPYRGSSVCLWRLTPTIGPSQSPQ